MKLILRILLNSLAVYITSKVVPGVAVADFTTALVFALIFGILNALIKPIILILTLPVNILTLGLFTLVINAFMVTLAASFVPGFHIDSFLDAVFFSIVLSIVSGVFHFIA